MTTREDLLAEIDAYLEKYEMAPSAFGRLVMNDGHFVTRIRAGGQVLSRTVDRVRAFMANYGADVDGSRD